MSEQAVAADPSPAPADGIEARCEIEGESYDPNLAGSMVDCDPAVEDDTCGGGVCVPGLEICMEACETHEDCRDGFFCGENGTGVVHCAECDGRVVEN